MIKILISIFTVFMIFKGCAGVSDVVEDLPNEYVYVDEAPQQKWIMKDPLSIDSDLYIPCQILEYKYNKKYIIAKIKFHYDINCVAGFIESKTLKEGKIYYYIIDTEKNIRYGAFQNENTFRKTLNKLNIDLEF